MSKVPRQLSKLDPEIDQRAIKIKVRTPRSPFLCSQVFLDRPRAPQDAKSYQNGVPKSKVESHFAYSTGIFSYSTGKCSYSTGIRARAPDPNPSETPAVTSKVIQSCPKVTKTHQYWTQDSTEFQHLRKIGFCNTFHTKCLFLEPQTSRFRP